MGIMKVTYEGLKRELTERVQEEKRNLSVKGIRYELVLVPPRTTMGGNEEMVAIFGKAYLRRKKGTPGLDDVFCKNITSEQIKELEEIAKDIGLKHKEALNYSLDKEF